MSLKVVIVWERVNPLPELLHNPDFVHPWKSKVFENILGKGENAGNQHFLLFPQCFLLFPHKSKFLSHNYFVFCKCFELGLGLKFFRLVKNYLAVCQCFQYGQRQNLGCC